MNKNPLLLRLRYDKVIKKSLKTLLFLVKLYKKAFLRKKISVKIF